MIIYVDGDACPKAVKEILFRASERTRTQLVLVANNKVKIPKSGYISFMLVQAGLDVADHAILHELAPGDIVITADIPLAAQVIEKEGLALNPRGELYTEENVRSYLSIRDFNDSLRSCGLESGGPPPLSKKDVQKFANNLDKFLTRNKV